VPRRSPCLALRASSVNTLCHRTWCSKNIERRLPAPAAPSVFGDAVNCPGVPLVWPCVLPQWRPCVTGHGVRKNIERRLAATVAHGIFWRHCCELPRRFPCLVLRASSVETLHHRTCGIRKRSRRLQTLSPKVVDHYLLLVLLSKFKVRMILTPKTIVSSILDS
jgi:hypothetical protein